MKRPRKTIALIFGGRSAEHDVSLSSAAAVYRNIDRRKFRVVSIFIDRDGAWKTAASPLLSSEKLAAGPAGPFLPWAGGGRTRVKADIYFPVLHGPFGEDGTIQGLLEMADVPYVGAGVLGSAAGMDKDVMKTLFAARGLPIVKHITVRQEEWRTDSAAILGRIGREFRWPVFVKPANLGSSVGISKVGGAAEAAGAIRRAFRFDRKIVVEQGLEAREIECSVLGNDRPKASLPGEIFPHRDFYDYRDKYLDNKTTFRIPAELPPETTDRVRRLAVEAFRAVEGSGLARLDFFVDKKSGEVFVNEINTLPGFTEISMYPKLWAATGLPFGRLVEELVRLGFERHRLKKRTAARPSR